MSAPRFYRNADDTRRARLFQRADGAWDYEGVIRFAGGGWHVAIKISDEDERAFDDESHARLMLADWLMFNCREDLIPIDVEVLTEGWPPEPPPYKTPKGARPIVVGSIWRKGSRDARVEHYGKDWRETIDMVRTRYVSSVTDHNRGSGRTSAAGDYSEERFRKLFKFVRNPDEES